MYVALLHEMIWPNMFKRAIITLTISLAFGDFMLFQPPPISSTPQTAHSHFDDNSISSIPRTTFVPLLERLLTNV